MTVTRVWNYLQFPGRYTMMINKPFTTGEITFYPYFFEWYYFRYSRLPDGTGSYVLFSLEYWIEPCKLLPSKASLGVLVIVWIPPIKTGWDNSVTYISYYCNNPPWSWLLIGLLSIKENYFHMPIFMPVFHTLLLYRCCTQKHLPCDSSTYVLNCYGMYK